MRLKHTLLPAFCASIACALCLPAHGQTFSGPLHITAGGSYSGNWQSLDPTVPAVIVDTTAAVTIHDSIIQSAGDCINCPNSMAHNLTVQNVSGYGLNPLNTSYFPGRFIHGDLMSKLVVEHCYLEGTSGIGLNGYTGSRSGDQTILIRYNQARNIDGRYSLGSGGGSSTTSFYRVQFTQISNYGAGVPGMEIAWNEIINTPYKSRVEDNINIYNTAGTSASHLLIHDNYVQGAYPANVGDSYSGGGIITDGGNTSDPNATTAFVEIYNNQVVSTGNYGFSNTTGHDNSIHNNRCVSTGYLADGTTYSSNSSATGMVNWDDNNDTAKGTFFNDHVQNNNCGLARLSGTTLMRSDYWLPALDEYSQNSGLGVTLDHNAEMAEFASWRNKLASNSITPGVPNAAIIYQAETLKVYASSGDTHRIIGDMNFNGYFGTILDANAANDYVTYLAPAIAAHAYDLRIGVKKSAARGIFQFAAASASVGTFSNVGTTQDLYSATDTWTEIDLGTWTPASSSDKLFRFTITGKNSASSGYAVCVDYVKLIPQ